MSAVGGFRRALAALTALGSLVGARPVLAYCRTTTCGSAETADCAVEPRACAEPGIPVYWPEADVAVWVENGSDLRGISAETAQGALERAFRPWMMADCAGAHPSIGLVALGQKDTNAAATAGFGALPDPGTLQNRLRFVDRGWPHDRSVIALTTVQYGLSSGRLIGADIEANSEDFEMTVVDRGGYFDLQAILTHEAGHLLGLSHVIEPDATMYGSYNGRGRIDPRFLGDDDQQGVCAVYVPGRFADDGCSCVVGRAGQSTPTWAAALGVATVSIALRRRRRRSS